jgi:hypothetical protein
LVLLTKSITTVINIKCGVALYAVVSSKELYRKGKNEVELFVFFAIPLTVLFLAVMYTAREDHEPPRGGSSQLLR